MTNEKLDIESNKVLSQQEVEAVKETLKGKVFDKLLPEKNDYVDQFDRGTVKYDENFRNYSFHKINFPDNEIIKDKNFAQKNPHTVSISGKGLTFIGCNLCNVELDPSWVLIDCVAQHTIREQINENGKNFIIQKIEVNGQMVEIDRIELVGVINGT